MFYSAFGLSVATNHPVPGLGPESEETVADTRIWFNALPMWPTIRDFPGDPWYVSDRVDEQPPGLRVWKLADGAYFRLLYSDGTEFFVDRSGTEVWATWLDPATLEDTTTYLLGPILGFVLQLRGLTCLHASAVGISSGRAIALVGPPRAGKSTAAAIFATLGYPILSDDVAPLVEREGQLYVEPSYPQLRLWPDSVALLYGSSDALPPLTPSWDKRALDLTRNGYRFQRQPLRLAAIYVLGDLSPDGETHVERLQGREVLRALLANTYVGYLLDEKKRREQFALLGQLAASVPVRRVAAPAAPGQFSRLCACILDDCEALGCTASPITAR